MVEDLADEETAVDVAQDQRGSESTPQRAELLAEIVRQLDSLDLDLPADPGPGAELRNDLGLTSLDAVDLVLALEDRYDIELEDEDVAELQTLGDVVDAVLRRS